MRVRQLGRIAGGVLAAVTFAGCGGDEPTTAITGTAVPTTTSTSTTTTVAPDPRPTFDDGRLLVTVPDGFHLERGENAFTGPFGDQIVVVRFNGPSREAGGTMGQTFAVSVQRGPTVTGTLERPPMAASTLDGGRGRQIYQGGIDAPIPTRYVGWRVDDETVVWVTSPSLDHAEIAEIMRGIDLVS